jgi:hypothetical protein
LPEQKSADFWQFCVAMLRLPAFCKVQKDVPAILNFKKPSKSAQEPSSSGHPSFSFLLSLSFSLSLSLSLLLSLSLSLSLSFSLSLSLSLGLL